MSKLTEKDVLNGIINRKPLFIPFPQVWGESVRNCGNYLWKSVIHPSVILVVIVSHSLIINGS
jgi:hypothetical protein